MVVYAWGEKSYSPQKCFYISLQIFGSPSTVTLPETLLFVSTLDGSLHAVSKRTGSIKWTLKEGNWGLVLG